MKKLRRPFNFVIENIAILQVFYIQVSDTCYFVRMGTDRTLKVGEIGKVLEISLQTIYSVNKEHKFL